MVTHDEYALLFIDFVSQHALFNICLFVNFISAQHLLCKSDFSHHMVCMTVNSLCLFVDFL